jgi:hypothetical protein
MPANSRIAQLRLLFALVFASATVIGLAAPIAAMALAGHGPSTHHVAGGPPCHGEDQPAPDPASDTAARLSCLDCVIHCLGSAILDAGSGSAPARPWAGETVPVRDGSGTDPARLERPPDPAG